MKRKGIEITAIYSLLHMFVDCVCAYAMFGYFMDGSWGNINVLLYNFCAFALQMPFGIWMDMLELKKRRIETDNYGMGKTNPDYAVICSAVGLILTLLGVFTGPVVLGIGNALFHVGGGIGTIHEDFRAGFKGKALGVFVAPGAFGLFVGTQLGNTYGTEIKFLFVLLTAIIMAGLMAVQVFVVKKQIDKNEISEEKHEELIFSEPYNNKIMLITVCCFVVVIIRSYVGMAVSMPWKTTLLMSTIGVLAVVFGKMAGGFASAKFGTGKTVVISLFLAAFCYAFCKNAVFGIGALFLFNMTMPITLYELVKRLKGLPGFSFGLLTFGLFLGFLPTYFGIELSLKWEIIGLIGSIISLVLLFPIEGGLLKKRNKYPMKLKKIV